MINLLERKNMAMPSGLYDLAATVQNETIDEVISLNPDPQPVPLPTHKGWWVEAREPKRIIVVTFPIAARPMYDVHGLGRRDCELGNWLPVPQPKFPEPEKPHVPERVTLWRSEKTGKVIAEHCSNVGTGWNCLGDYVREEPTP